MALDLGSTTFKLALVQMKDSVPKVLESKLLELPRGTPEAARLQALKSLLSGIKLSEVNYLVSVMDDPFACLHTVMTPPMPSAELKEAALWELQRYLAVPPEQVLVDIERMGEIQKDGAKRLKLLAAAIPAAAVEEHLKFLGEAGVKPHQLLPKASAVAGWLAGAKAASSDPVALLAIGAKSSEFLVVQAGKPVFYRKIPVAGEDVTRGMMTVLVTPQGQVGLTELEAETLKRAIGIPSAGSAGDPTHGISGEQLLSLIRGTLENLTTEVERSLAFYGESSEGTGVTELILVGGGAHLKGLPEWLGERLGLRVRSPMALEFFSVTPGSSAAQMPLSLVPVLGAAMSAGRGINWLPTQLKEAVQIQVKRSALTGIATAVILGTILLWTGMKIYGQSLEKQAAALRIELAAVTPDLPKAKATLGAHAWASLEPHWEELFKEMSHRVPPEIHLTEWNLDEKRLGLRGRIRGRVSADVILADFMRSLGKGLFTQVRLGSTRKLGEPTQEEEFEVQCLIP